MARIATLAAGQYQCVVGDKAANLSKIERLTREAASKGAELVCFPEMGLTGAAQNTGELAEGIPGPTVEHLGRIAAANRVCLIAGMPERCSATGRLHNAAVLLHSDGTLAARYRKRCLYLGEDSTTPGSESVYYDAGDWKLGMTICYDYVFAEYIRELADGGAELICHPTAWLTTDTCEAWHYSPLAFRAMGMTRALENTVYFLSANLWGDYDRRGTLRAIGQSAIIAPWGEILAEVKEGEGVAVAQVDFDAAKGWRRAAAPYPSDRIRYGF